jgi:rfaE bifunctional protein nucleotidyltransferase chain/domain
MAIWTEEEAIHQVRTWKQAGKRVVFTNGCFDLLHRGHVEYLEAARHEGDVLIIGLNSDASVKRLKGPPRPFQSESDRAYILDHLKAVTGVVIFEEETPARLIERLEPDVLVKGADYEVKEIAGSQAVLKQGGRVVTIPFQSQRSTTELIQRIYRGVRKILD